MKEYYHVSSHGLERNLIFKSEKDFITGVNDLAICLLKFNVRLLCYCLMDNHFHLILEGLQSECTSLVLEYKRICAMRMRYNAGEVNALQNVDIQFNRIDNNDYLESAIAYVLRNPLAARIIMMPHHYPWSSADIYFKGSRREHGIKLNDMPERKRYRILKSKARVPDNYLIDEQGMILPECFVDTKEVEDIFKHPSRLMLLLAKKIEAELEIAIGITQRITHSDSAIKTMTLELIHDIFHVKSINQLTMEQKIRLCPMMKRNFCASNKQIARITRLPLEIVMTIV